MNSTGVTLSIFLRTLATFRVLTGLAMLAFVGLLVFEFRERSFIWGAVGIAIVLSLKGWFALLVGSRVLRQGRCAAIGPAEWTTFGIGYCFAASAFLAAIVAGEGWVYGLFAVFFAAIAAVWFVLASRGKNDVNSQGFLVTDYRRSSVKGTMTGCRTGLELMVRYSQQHNP